MKRRINAAVLTALLLVGAVLVAGCGGGEDTADAIVRLTKAEFIKQGDAICKEVFKRREQQANEFGEENDVTFGSASEEQLEKLVTEVVVPSLEQQADELSALGTPKGDEKQIEEIIASLKGAAGEIRNNPKLIFKSNPLEEPDELARAYGFKVCVE
ncbi:MAG TPA: hypothetical protein VFS54_10450 [Solirubrobacterales bacterium]|nr:hypothetical protein [Solirubrobacterales bacterium]